MIRRNLRKMTLTDKEIIDRITMVCQSDAGVKLGYDDTAWTDKEKLEQIMRILGKTTQTEKEKIEEVLRIVNKRIEDMKIKGMDKRTAVVWLQDSMVEIKETLEK